MRKRFLLATILAIGTLLGTAQVKIGSNPTTLDTNSLLELESATKGILMPRLTDTAMNRMSPPDGMLLYNKIESALYLRSERVWKKLAMESDTDNNLGYVYVQKYCTGTGTLYDPWVSADSSAGIKEALRHVSPTRRTLYFRQGFYATQGAQEIDFSRYLPISDPTWLTTFAGFGISFIGNGASIYVNHGGLLTGGHPGIVFNWPGQHAFYWKFTGLQFYGNVDTALVQFGSNYDFPLNGCDFDLSGNNGYVSSSYRTVMSPASAIKIFWPLECRMHLVGVSATGAGVSLVTSTFCTISGAFSNTVIPGTNTIYPNSYGLQLVNAQSNNFTSMDLEVAYNGVKFDQWSIQNTFSAVFVANCDSNGAVLDNSAQATTGKNLILSIRVGSTIEAPTSTVVPRLYSSGSDSTKFMVLNYFSY